MPPAHERREDRLPTAFPGVAAACREIVPTLIRQTRDTVHRARPDLPAKARGVVAARQMEGGVRSGLTFGRGDPNEGTADGVCRSRPRGGSAPPAGVSTLTAGG